MSRRGEIDLVRGSGNVFRDLGIADADILQAKSILAARIIGILEDRRLSVRAAEKRTGAGSRRSVSRGKAAPASPSSALLRPGLCPGAGPDPPGFLAAKARAETQVMLPPAPKRTA